MSRTGKAFEIKFADTNQSSEVLQDTVEKFYCGAFTRAGLAVCVLIFKEKKMVL